MHWIDDFSLGFLMFWRLNPVSCSMYSFCSYGSATSVSDCIAVRETVTESRVEAHRPDLEKEPEFPSLILPRSTTEHGAFKGLTAVLTTQLVKEIYKKKKTRRKLLYVYNFLYTFT